MHRQHHRDRDKDIHELSLEITEIIAPRRHSAVKFVEQSIGIEHVRRSNKRVFLKSGKLLNVVIYVSAVCQEDIPAKHVQEAVIVA